MASAGIPTPVRVLGDNNFPDVDHLMGQNVSPSGVHGGEVPTHSPFSSILSKPNSKGRNSKPDTALLAREALKTAQPVSPLPSIYQLGIGEAHSFQPPCPQPRQWSSASTFAPASSSHQPFGFGDEPEPDEEDILEPSSQSCKTTKEHTTGIPVDEKDCQDWWLIQNSELYLIAEELNLDDVEVREWAERLRARQEARRAGTLG